MKNLKLLLGLITISTIVLFTACNVDDIDETTIIIVYDCPEIEADFGDSCTINTGGGVITGSIDENCDCRPDIQYDCPGIEANFGDSCWVDPAGTIEGVINNNCECISNDINYDCPDLEGNIGDTCMVGGIIGFIDENCNCTLSTFDCPDWFANVGDPCRLNPTSPDLGTLNDNCECIE